MEVLILKTKIVILFCACLLFLSGCIVAADRDKANLYNQETVTLTLEDGDEIECTIFSVFSIPKSTNKFIALLPLEGPDANEDIIYLYKYIEMNGKRDIVNIESDSEYLDALDAFEKMYASIE